MSGEHRLFTVAEADALLPEIVPLLETLREAQRVMEETHEAVTAAVPGNGGGVAGTAFLDASHTASTSLARLEEIGVVVRDPSSGLIDFPAQRDGDDVFLCWRLGEERVAWWHPTDSGFAGRQPL